jgi:hypothetical protein
MPATLTQVVKQFQQEWTTQLEPEAILSVCHDIGYEWRERCLDPVTTMQFFFVQIVNGHTACTHLRHLTKLDVSASAYCQARTRLPLEVFHRLLRAVGDDLQREPLEEGRWLGHRTFWADGSSFSMSDTPELQDHFGQPGGQQPGCGFPVAHLMALFHAGTGMVLKMLSAPLRTPDLSQVVQLHPELRPGDVLVTDRGLWSYAHLALLVQGGRACRGAHAPEADGQLHPGAASRGARQTGRKGAKRPATLALAETAGSPRPSGLLAQTGHLSPVDAHGAVCSTAGAPSAA